MKLFQIIASAQGSRAFFNMGQAFGFGDELMAQTVRYFIPPMAKAIEKRAQTPEGLQSVLEFLGSRRYDRFLDDPRIFGHAQVLKEGERVLDYLFVREARIKKIIENRAKVLPIEASALEKILPYIAVMVIGAIEVKTRRPLGVIWHRITKGASDDRALANPYLALVQYLKKQEREQKDHRRRRLFAFLGVGSSASPAPAPAVPEPALEAPALFQSA
ncbi:MAG: DUF937 domain-containing protein [Rhodomicrobium sp.]